MAVKKQEKKPTAYVVLRSADPGGPFSVVGGFTAQGQTAAKRAAVASEQENEAEPEKDFFIAVPASSFAPERPTVKWIITFEGVDGVESVEADEPEDDDEDDDEPAEAAAPAAESAPPEEMPPPEDD